MGSQLWVARGDAAREVSHHGPQWINGLIVRRWQIGTALYILGLISYQGALTCESPYYLEAQQRVMLMIQSGPRHSQGSLEIYQK